MNTMRAVVYPPPRAGYPHVAVIFHTDGSIALTRPFVTADEARRYIADVSSSLVAVESEEAANA